MIQKWKVYCETEKAFIFSESVEKPRQCPRDSNHTINALYTTAVICRDLNVVKEVRFSPPAIQETILGRAPVWEKLGGFQVGSPGTSPAFQRLSMICTPNIESTLPANGPISVRLYEPATSRTLAEVSHNGTEGGTPFSIVSTVDFSEATSEYLEVHVSASGVPKTIQEILLQWK